MHTHVGLLGGKAGRDFELASRVNVRGEAVHTNVDDQLLVGSPAAADDQQCPVWRVIDADLGGGKGKVRGCGDDAEQRDSHPEHPPTHGGAF